MSLNSCIPFPLDESILHDLIGKGKDWSLCHGIAMRSRDAKDAFTFVPFLLFPSTFPRVEFEKVVKIQTTLQKLIHLVSEDDKFLRSSLQKTILVDEFTRRLFLIYDTVRNEGVAQPLSLGLIRSDYILDLPDNKAKQVEINMIASSFGAVTSVLPEWHRYALNYLGEHEKAKKVASSGTLQGYAHGILQAWNLYSNPEAAILFVCEEPTYNIGDQRLLEYEILHQNPKAKVIRMSLTEIGEKAKLDPLQKSMSMYLDRITIGVIYFRDGYSPDAFKSELEWDARLFMERSNAIKCPSIQYHLAGTKKIQQELARPGVLEMFLSDFNEIKAVREIFTGLFSLDLNDAEADKIIDEALADPNHFVLKPQREGGGNNLYDDDIKKYFEKNRNSEDRTAWILMHKITAPVQKNYMVRPGLEEPIFTEMAGELGIFGTLIGSKDKILLNEQVGQMLRTKAHSSNEVGVAVGFGAIDSICLTD